MVPGRFTAVVVLTLALVCVGRVQAEGAPESLAAARALFDSGDLETALVFYEKAVQQDPNNAVAHAGVGKTRFQLGDATGAVLAYQNAVRLAPNVPALQQALRQAQTVALRNAPPVAPTPSGPWRAVPPVPAQPLPVAQPMAAPVSPAEQYRQQGVKHYEGGRFLFAVKAFEKSIALDPAPPETHARLGDCYVALRRTRDAVAEYRKAVQGAPYNVEINLAFANALAADGDVEGSRRAYQGVLEIDPGQRRAREALSELKRHAARPPVAPPAAPMKSEAPKVAPKPQPTKVAPKPVPAKVAARPEPAKIAVNADPAPSAPEKGKKKGAKDDALIGDLMADPLGKGD